MDIGNWWPSSARINPTKRSSKLSKPRHTLASKARSKSKEGAPQRVQRFLDALPSQSQDEQLDALKRIWGDKHAAKIVVNEPAFIRLVEKLSPADLDLKPGWMSRHNPTRRPSNISEAKWNRWIEDWRRIGGRKARKNPGAPSDTSPVMMKMRLAAARIEKARLKELHTRKNPHFPGKLGTGSRFAACKKRVEATYAKKGKSVNSSAVCATIGRRAYGAKRFKTLAVAGKRRRK